MLMNSLTENPFPVSDLCTQVALFVAAVRTCLTPVVRVCLSSAFATFPDGAHDKIFAIKESKSRSRLIVSAKDLIHSKDELALMFASDRG